MISSKLLQQTCTIEGQTPDVISSPSIPANLKDVPYFASTPELKQREIIQPPPVLKGFPEPDEKSLLVSPRRSPKPIQDIPLNVVTEKVAVSEHQDRQPIIQQDINKCPCIIVSKGGEKKVCGRPAKNNGRCGIHRTKCTGVDIEVKDEIKRPERPAAVFAEHSTTCPCIIVSRKVGEQQRVCGRKIKENGRCGIHKTTCMLPGQQESKQVEQEERKMASQLKCTCLIKKTGQPCGRPVVSGTNRCSRHQKKCLKVAIIARPLEVPKVSPVVQPLIDEEEEMWKEFDDELEHLGEGVSEEDTVPIQEVVEEEPIKINEEEIGDGWTRLRVANVDEITAFVKNIENNPAIDITEMVGLNDKIIECLLTD